MSERLTPLIYVVIRDGHGNRQRVTEQTYHISKIEYTDSVKHADKCVITVLNDDLSNWDDPVWFHGNFVQVSWGYPGQMALTRELIITKVKGFTELHVEARAKSVLIDAVKKSRTFRNMTRSEIARQIAREYGYDDTTILLDDTGHRFAHVTQAGLSDAQFLRKLAVQEGYEFYVDHEGLHFHEVKLAQEVRRVFTWQTDLGRGDVLTVSVESEKTRKAGAVTKKGRDPLTKETQTAEASNATDTSREGLAVVFFAGAHLFTGRTVVQDRTRKLTAAEKFLPAPAPPNTTPASFDKSFLYEKPPLSPNMSPEMKGRPPWLYRPEELSPMTCIGDGGRSETKAKFRGDQRQALKIKLTAVGDPSLLAKSVVRLEGVGRRLTGNYFVHEVKHTVSPGEYTMALTLKSDGFNEEGDTKAKRSSGIPEVGGEASKAKRKPYAAPSGKLFDKDALEPYTILDKTGKPVMTGYRPKQSATKTLLLTTSDKLSKASVREIKPADYLMQLPSTDVAASPPSNKTPAKKGK